MVNLKKIFLSTGLVTLTTFSICSTGNAFSGVSKTLLVPITAPAPEPAPVEETAKITQSMLSFHMSMRAKAAQCISYSRNLIVSSVADLGDTKKVIERLLKSQDEAAAELKTIYGEEFGTKYTAVMKDHLVIAEEYVVALRASDADKTQVALTKWHANVDALVELFSGANPNIQKTTLSEIAHKNLDSAVEQINARIKLDWDADIAAFDRGTEQMLLFVDALIDATIKQFPDKFL